MEVIVVNSASVKTLKLTYMSYLMMDMNLSLSSIILPISSTLAMKIDGWRIRVIITVTLISVWIR